MKQFLALILLGIIGMKGNAQFSFGMHGGALYCPATAKSSTGNSFNQEPSWGAKIGFAGKINIGKRVALIPETSLVLRNTSLTSNIYIQGGSYTEHLRFQMIMVENNIHVAYVGTRPSGFIAAIGPGVSVGVAGSTTEETTEGGSSVSSTQKETTDGYPNLKEVELSISGYIGYRFGQHFIVKISFLNGISNLGKNGASFRGSYVGAGLGVFFGKKGSTSPKYNNPSKKEKDI